MTAPTPIRRRARRFALGTLVLAGLLLAVLAGLLGTQAGLGLLLSAARPLLPAGLEPGQLSGTLLEGVQIEGLHYRSEALDLQLARADCRWQPPSLLARRLQVQRCTLTGLRVALSATEGGEPAALPTSLGLPFLLRMDALALNQVELLLPGRAEPLRLESLEAAFSLDGRALKLQRLELRSLNPGPALPVLERFALAGRVAADAPFDLDLRTEWALALSEGPGLAASGTLQGDLSALALRQSLARPLPATLTARLRDPLGTLDWDATLNLSATGLAALGVQREGLELEGALSASGTLERAEARLGLDSRDPLLGPWRSRLSLDWAGGGTLQVALESAAEPPPAAAAAPPSAAPAAGEADAGAGTGATATVASLRAQGTLELAGAQPAARLEAQWEALGWPLTGGPAEYLSPEGRLRFEGWLEDYRLRVEAMLQAAELPPAQLELEGRGGGSRLRLERLQASGDWGRVQGTGTLDGESLEAALEGDWSALRLPEQVPVESPEGSFSLHASAADYRFDTRFTLTGTPGGPAVPEARVSVSGRGEGSALRLEPLEVRTLGGVLQGHLQTDFSGERAFELALQGRELDPGLYQAQWPGRLGFRIAAEGVLADGGPRGAVSLEALDGELRGFPLSGSGKVDNRGGAYRLDGIALQSGRTALRLDGVWGAPLSAEQPDGAAGDDGRVQLDFDLDSPDLADVWPGAAGRLQARGRVHGPAAALRAEGSLEADRLQLAGALAQALSATLDFDLSDARPSRLALQGRGLAYQGEAIDSVSLDATGRLAGHAITLEAAGPRGRIDLALQGGMQAAEWQGQLQRLALTLAEPAGLQGLDQWTLRQPAGLVLGRERARLDEACLSAPSDAGLCAGGSWAQSGPWSLRARLSELALGQLPLGLPEGMALGGTLEARAELSGSAGWPQTGTVEARTGEVLLVLPQAEDIRLRQSRASARLGDERLQVALSLEPDNTLTGPVSGELSSPWPSSPAPLAPLPLAGSLQAEVPSLAPLESLLPELSGLAGQARVDLRLAGTLGAPALSGAATVQARADVPRFGISLEAVKLEARGDGERLALSGSAQSGSGTLALEGELVPRVPLGGSLRLDGERFEAMNTADGQIWVSPRLSLRAQGRQLWLQGEINVPEARLTPGEMLKQSPLSDDVVVRGRESESAAGSKEELYATLKLVLGDAVRLESSGVTGRLSGDLLVLVRPGQPTRGVGEVGLKEGKFGFLGASLTIDKAEAQYAGGALDNPDLDIRASRTARDGTVAGVKLDGPLHGHRVTLYSEPPLSDENILSYLTLGRSLSGLGGDQGAMLLDAATTLGFRTGDKLTQSLASTFGLDELSFGSVVDASAANGPAAGTAESVGLTVGKHLTPKLYVGYGFGLLSEASVFQLRYKLGRSWSLEGSSGQEQGLDLLYSIER